MNSDDVVSVRVALWDVRAQWESGLRTLSMAQNYLDQWSHLGTDEQRQAVAEVLQHQLGALQEVNATVRHLLGEVGDAFSPPAKAD